MLSILARRINDSVFKCFTWKRDARSGIARAWCDARHHGIEIIEAWAEEV